MSDPRISQIEYRDFSAKLHRHSFERERVIKAQLEITYRCNLHCRHCYTDCYNCPGKIKNELTLGEIKRILDEMAGEGILWLNLTGGEILMRKDFFDIYDYAYDLGFILTLFTNGTLLTDKIIARLKKRPPFFIDVSCHSVREDAFDWFTKTRGSFQRFSKGIQLLKESGLPFYLKTKAMNWNLSELSDIRHFFESFGLVFDYTTTLYPTLNGDLAPLQFRLSPEVISNLEAFDLDTSCTGRKASTGKPATDQLYRCLCATNMIHINAFGELGTCTQEYEVRASLKEYSLKTAIEHVFPAVRSLKYESDSPCRDCNLYLFCQKKPTSARLETGDAKSPVPYYCDLAYNLAKKVTDSEIEHPLQGGGTHNGKEKTLHLSQNIPGGIEP
ncbi:MAG: radical SAM protein [Candidatus Omnitrophica bacterium]|nr:radical SAM protein [Candidatus Omnitrophota bacterium]